MHRSLLFLLLITAWTAAACSKDPDVAKREFVQSGDEYARNGQHREAVIEYRNALQQDALFGDARLKLSESYRALGDNVNAALELVRAADALPGDIAVQVRAGNELLVARRFEEALARADKALAAQPGHVEALVLRANALAGMSRLEDAVTDIGIAIANDPGRAGSYMTLGAMQFVRGDRGQAEAAFKRAVDIAPSSVAAHLALANFFLATGNQAATEAELKAATALDPEHVLANRALAYFYIGAGRAAEGERYLRVVANAAPDASGRFGLGDFYLSQGRVDDARQTYLQIATGNEQPHAAAASLRLATMDFAAGNTAEARRRVDAVLATDNTNTLALTAKAELLASAGDLDGALNTVRLAVESNRNASAAHYALGKIHLLRNEPVEGERAFAAAVQLNPRMAPARVELATLQLESGRLPDAEQMAQTALTMAPGARDARLVLARVGLARGDVARAESLVRPLEKEMPGSVSVLTTVGALELAKGQPARARAALDRALVLDAHSLDALRLLTRLDVRERRSAAARDRLTAAMQANPASSALVLLAANTAAATGDVAEAERLAKAALALDANALEAYSILGTLYGRGRRLGDATAEFQKLGERQPTSVPVHTTIGTLLQMQGRTDDARTVFERVVGLDPNAAVAANNLAWIYAEHGGDIDRALQLAQAAKARLTNEPAVNDTLGWVLYKKGLAAEALKPLQEAAASAPDVALYQHHLGLAYAATGQAAPARQALSRALAIDHQYGGAVDVQKALDSLGK